MNELAQYNRERRRDIEALRDRQIADRAGFVTPEFAEYPLQKLQNRIARALSEKWGKGNLEPHFELIERDRLGGDLALRFPQLLREGGPKKFIKDHLPWIVEILSGAAFVDAVARVDVKGMYINLTISDRWLLDSAQAITDAGAAFGRSNCMSSRTFAVDYSSPNVAKVLHAGHIRSTIVGHVLCNLFEACGARVFRINHINDFGGFGFTLEGYSRFKDALADFANENDRLLEIYRIRRTAERLVESDTAFDDIDDEQRALIQRYFPTATTKTEFARQFQAYTAAADARFAKLEAGSHDEVALWRAMVEWSLAEFDHFYRNLNIHFDFIIGESFYFEAGDRLIDRYLAEGRAVVFTQELADEAVRDLDAQLAREDIAHAERESLAGYAAKDVGAVVIPLDRNERFVVRRADGRSIYATRDIGAIALRREIFDPTDMVYVVGQEQQVHFDRLFRAAYITGLATPEAIRFQHIYFGFYVDSATGRKLSSRDSVNSVTDLLTESISYFRSRISDRGNNNTDQDLDQAARELAIGSLVFNDLKQDIKGAVEINVSDMQGTITSFEKSGAAYVVYAACRARSIMRRHGQKPVRASEILNFQLSNQEVELLLKLQQIPEKIAAAAEQASPSLLVSKLLEIATIYNSYYTRAPVIVDGVADQARLLITLAVQTALTNGLAVCHVTCPEAI
jgi:arginyl-tRNA synthetase